MLARFSECQLFLDVDCSHITYDTPPSPALARAAAGRLEAVTQAKGRVVNRNTDLEFSPSSAVTPGPGVALATSLLLAPLLSNPAEVDEAVIREAFCRDIDIFSLQFPVELNTQTKTLLKKQGEDGEAEIDEKLKKNDDKKLKKSGL